MWGEKNLAHIRQNSRYNIFFLLRTIGGILRNLCELLYEEFGDLNYKYRNRWF